MSAELRAPEPFDSDRHQPVDFACGQEPLDRWIKLYAGQSQRRDAARTFVATADGRAVIGYYTLVAGEIEHPAATPPVRRGLSRHFPIPVAILARLAVHSSHHGLGIGASLLADGLRRVIRASEDVAVRGVVVHATDDRAAAFYEHHGFRPLTDDPRTLMVSLVELRVARLR